MRIFQPEDDGKIIKGDEQLKKHITDYYRGLFGSSDISPLTMDEGRREDIPQVTDDDKEKLIVKFSYNEVREAIFQMEHNKAPDPDGFSAEFYQAFWVLIKDDLMAMFVDFYNGTLRLYSLNFGIITLLPKKDNAVQIQQYRPICLLNVSFKISTKVEVNRLTQVADKVIRPTQSAFMPGRYILEGVVILHETLHELHKNKMNGVILKLDFEKAYDKVKWSFLQQTLKMKGFPVNLLCLREALGSRSMMT